VAEDNAVNRMVALAQLLMLGYQADAVTNGAEAVEAVEGGGYDIVLMDCQMPVMDGFEATRGIRKSAHPTIPIIALTASAMTSDRDRCLAAGMNDYLSKPVEMTQLQDVLARWLPANGAPKAAEIDGQCAREQEKRTFNVDALLHRLMGDRQLAGIAIKGFVEDFPNQLDNLRKRIREADAGGIRVQAHALQGAAGTVGADGLQAAARSLESAGTSGQMERCTELLPSVVEEFERFKKVLESPDMAFLAG
jgi:CheY-like chemotaxis protein/HPt (histidine-containing phosphotransfer) domain-containing protein